MSVLRSAAVFAAAAAALLVYFAIFAPGQPVTILVGSIGGAAALTVLDSELRGDPDDAGGA
jgi:hypothetical protein